MQKPLFGKGIFSDSKLILNSAVAFGVTKTGLKEGDYSVLENIFYGINNLKIPLEILGLQNPAEILSEFFAAGGLKRGDRHLTLGIPQNFLKLVNYINWYSYNNKKFASLAHNFKKCFDDSPGKQKERLELLEENAGDRFVGMFFNKYRFSNKDKKFNYDFYDPNWEWDARNKGIYADIIYKEFKSLSEKVKQI